VDLADDHPAPGAREPVRDLLAPAREILERGSLCYLAGPSPHGPHVTPVVFALEGDRVWGTTGRSTTKVRRWRDTPVASGLVRLDDRAVTFRGAVTRYDGLDPSTWAESLARAPSVAVASARFTLKNARFFAGYARDAGKVPLSWTPPGRVIFSVDLDAGAVLESDRVSSRWGRLDGSLRSRPGFRSVRASLPRTPEAVRRLVGRRGAGTLAFDGSGGAVVLPAVWARAGGVVYAAVPREMLALAGGGPEGLGALVIDEASSWRASRMKGVLLRGPAAVYLPGDLRTGARTLGSTLAGLELPPDPAIVRVRTRSLVWWDGWASGTVVPR
jgi:hypothetical protein